MSKQTYQVWNGEYWTFEQIIENLSRLVRSIVARTTPEECIDDCMQDAWLRLYERLEADPQALGPDPHSKSPCHTRSYYANRIVWDAHKGSGYGPITQTYYRSQVLESEAFDQDRTVDEFHFGDVPGLDTVLFADEYHRNWVEEADVRLDLDEAVGRIMSCIQRKVQRRYAMALLCVLYGVPIDQGAVLAGCNRSTMHRDTQETRMLLQFHLHPYDRPGPRYTKMIHAFM